MRTRLMRFSVSALAITAVAAFTSLSAAAQSFSQTLPWNYSTGNSSSFSAYLNGQVTVSGDSTGTGVAAQTAAGGSILGHSKEIFSASASLSASLGVPAGTVTAKVFGNTTYSKSVGSPFTGDVYKENYDSCKTLDQSLCAIQDFQVGPFNVLVEAGVKGSVALNYSIGLTKGVASAGLTPAVSGAVYVMAELDFFFADVGVGANLTLINDTLPMGVTAALAPNYFMSPPGWGVKWGYNIRNKLNLLSGNIFLYADISFPFFSESWNTTIFSWPGMTTDTTLYNGTGWVPIGVPLPYLSSLSPPSVTAGSGNLQVTINGSGFDTVDPFSVQLDGSPVTYQNLTATQVVVGIPSSSLISPGVHHVTVANGGSLGGTSNPLPFHVLLGAPVLTQVSPGAVTAGGASFTLTVSGASLISGSTIWWNSTPLITTYVSDSQLTAIVPTQDISSVGTAQISVHYPGTISPTSNVLILSIFDSNQPIVTQTFPSNAFPGASDLTMHVVGTGFVTGSTVYWSGSPLITIYVSGVQLDAQVPASLMAVQNVAQIDVLSPSGSPSNAVAFTIAPVTYTAEEIPLPPGQTGNWAAVAVNSNGLVAVNPLDTGFAYLWSEAGGIINLPIPLSPCVPLWASISDLNNLGQVVGSENTSNCAGQWFFYGNGALTFPFPQGFIASGINDSGMVVGLFPLWPAVWQAGTIHQLNGPGNPFGSSCCWINNAGQVIGSFDQFAPNENAYTAILWNGNSPTLLPNLYGDPLGGQIVSSINDFGEVVGHGASGWRWKDGTIVPLPIFPDGHVPIGPNEFAYEATHSINNSGDIIGTGANFAAVIYSHGQSYELNNLLSNPAIGQIQSALSIADNGLIVGILVHPDGALRPVLLKPDPVPPNPTTASASALTAQVARESLVTTGSVPGTASKDLVPKSRGFWNGSLVITTPVTGVQPSSLVAGTNNFHVTVNGSNFMNGAVVYWNGSPLNTIFGSTDSLVAAVPATLLASAGYATITAVNPGGDPSNGLVITIENPTPTVTMLSSVQTTAGTSSFTMTISGNNFLPLSQVYWNDVLLAATYVSSTQMTAVIPAAVLVNPSIAAITVVNPPPGGGASAPAVFGVNPPAPVASSISPMSSVIGSADLTMTVSGSGFDATSVVSWNDTALQTTYISPSTLSVQVPGSYLTTAGTTAVTVTDTIPGAWPSQSLFFTVDNPTPQVSNAAPASVQAGSSASAITLTGTGFVSGSQVYLDGSPLTTTYVSNSQLTGSLSNNDVALAKTAQLTVVNPQPCDTPASATPLAFTITAPPVIHSISPAMARAGDAAVAIHVTGSGFTSQSVVTWSGMSLATSVVSGTQLNATVPSQSIVSPGTFPIRVMQQAPGGGSSAAAAFTVYDTTLPQPAITALSPPAAMAGSNNFVLAISGNRIVSTTSVVWNGTTLPSAYISSNTILVPVPAANISSPGKATIQLQTPTDNKGSGGGLSNPVVFTVYDGTNVATTDYTSAAVFTTATSNITRIDFNGILPSGQNYEGFSPLSIYGITFSTPNPSTAVNVTASAYYAPTSYPGDYIVNSANPSADNTLVITLPNPTHAIGLNYGGLFGAGANTITLSNGHIFSQSTTPAAGKTQFVGFVSVDPITSLTLTTSSNSWVVLNLLIGSPLPPTTMLSSSLDPSIAGQTVTFTATVTPTSSTVIPTGSVVFLDGGIQIGTANLDSTGKAAFQTSGLSVAQHSINAQYVGDDNYSGGSASLAILQTVNAAPTPGFTFVSNPPSVIVSAPGGSSTPVTLAIAAENGYNGTVNFTPSSCSISPAGSLSSCSFSPASITGSGSTQVTINTTAASTSVPYLPYQPDGFNLPARIWVALLTLVLLLAIPKRRPCWRTAVSIVGFMLVIACFGCGGGVRGGGTDTGGGNHGTPTGVTYTVTVTATAAGGQPRHTASFAFTVQ